MKNPSSVESKKGIVDLRYLMLLLFCPILIIGCAGSAVDRKENYSLAWPQISYRYNDHLLIGVIDKRPYVTSGKVDPSYVGITRGGFGNPWYMHTESGKALAEDLSYAIVAGFKNSGINAEIIKLSHNASDSELVNGFLKTPKRKKLLVQINEWKSDTYTRTRFLFNLTIKIYDETGNFVSDVTEGNIDQREENQMVASAIEAGRASLTTILNNKSISDGLNSPSNVNSSTTVSESNPKTKVNLFPEKIKLQIRRKCSDDFPTDYIQQAECVKNQETAWLELNH